MVWKAAPSRYNCTDNLFYFLQRWMTVITIWMAVITKVLLDSQVLIVPGIYESYCRGLHTEAYL
jgi:hypothetical protein